MPIREKISAVDMVRQWTDAIPLHYEYTAGVAGERFLRGLAEGKLIGGRCDKCGVTFVPPKTYCVYCFSRATSFLEIAPVGTVVAISATADDGNEPRGTRFAFVQFDGVTGGLVHRLRGQAEVGARVRIRFKAKRRRKGSILDIECFELV